MINPDPARTDVFDERYKRQLDIIIKSAKPRIIPCLKLLFAFENISLIQQCFDVAMFLIQYVNPAVKGPYNIAESVNKAKATGNGVSSVNQTDRCTKYIDCIISGEILKRIQTKYMEPHNNGTINKK